ncbi:MAG: LysM peptidoglycan-binding domain-containing protein [Limosilactobacillus sp.]|uniref:aggregation-promoting factor n=1 Tax=Limosilactobacillus sp. TaxID=2773925 RepID=UPI003EFD2CA2
MISKKNIAKTVAALGTVALGVTAATTVANADAVYTVKSGDTLSSISQKFANNNSLVNTIAQDNHITDVNKIFVGQRLVIKGNYGQQQNQNTQNTNTTSQAAAQTQTTTNNNTANTSYNSSVSGSDAAAKAWIANRESGGNYGATNGQYIGKYQLSASYLNGDYSAANQERVADQYVASRYGSWTNAQQFWMANGWY